jgi:hypothetical protein
MQRSTLLGGALLAVVAGLLCLIGESLGLRTEHVALVGGALGGVAGLVQDRTPGLRAIGFGAGLAVAWIGFAIRALYLPDSTSGRALAATLVVVVCVVITAGAGSRIPLWTLLLGAAAMVAVYEENYTADSPAFLSESPTAATAVLLAAAIGFLATSWQGPPQALAAQPTDETPVHEAPANGSADGRPVEEIPVPEGDRA